MNDWSARDFARFEVQAGGVTTCKNFATTVAPWIVSIEALEPFKIVLPPQVPEPVSYLTGKMSRISYDINLRAEVGNRGQYTLATETHLKHVYWSPAQMIAHFTVSGANFRPGDIFATGTISGPEQSTWGCLMEKTWGGARSWNGPNGESKVWLEDGDDVIIQAYCEGNGVRIGFGKCAGLILPAIT